MTLGGGWLLEQRTTTVAQLHEPWPAPELAERRVVCRCEVVGPPSLVLGSAQGDGIADPGALAALGMELVHRRSGGGAVVVAPGAQLWVDVWVPRHDSLWTEDVVAGAFWVGDAWADALGSLDVAGTVHRGRAVTTAWSSLVCFAGMGPGEVSAASRKVVGLSQRRNRAGVRLQCVVLTHWDPEQMLRVLRLEDGRRRQALEATTSAAIGLDALLPGIPDAPARVEALAAALLAHLPG